MVIHKIGVVPLRRCADGAVQLLIHKPKPKQGDADIAWGLARGTRMYFDIDGNVWRDARERSTAEMYRDRLEDPRETAAREMHEELDVRVDELSDAGLIDLGVITYDSAQRMAYPIHWFSGWVAVDRARVPEDAAAVQWVTRDALHMMVERGEFKASYVPIVDAVLERVAV
ncbi:MAG: hypothetical protein C0436_02720 [Alphaproteobacteria bacterium]|nr:hypothetical protein [Alphaproteobacteria bacterium]